MSGLVTKLETSATKQPLKHVSPPSSGSRQAYVDEMKTYARKSHHPAVTLAALVSDIVNRTASKFEPGGTINTLMHGGYASPEADMSAAIDAALYASTGGMPFAPLSKPNVLGTITRPDLSSSIKQQIDRQLDDIGFTFNKLQRDVHDVDSTTWSLMPQYDDIWQKHKVYPWFDTNGKRVLLGEIPDTIGRMNLRTLDPRKNVHTGKLESFIRHPTMMSDPIARDFAKNIDVVARLNKPLNGELNMEKGLLKADAPNEEQLASVLLHEMTHGQSALHGLPAGYSPEKADYLLNNFNELNYIQQHLLAPFRNKPKGAQEVYSLEPGEALANTAEMRRYLKPASVPKISPLTTMNMLVEDPRLLLWGLK